MFLCGMPPCGRVFVSASLNLQQINGRDDRMNRVTDTLAFNQHTGNQEEPIVKTSMDRILWI
ncbi:hypothetical protein Pan258_59930 [Symmachiella dynata]|nr:hypothetical protein Pan258_59930 [Symmachiella dynata]